MGVSRRTLIVSSYLDIKARSRFLMKGSFVISANSRTTWARCFLNSGSNILARQSSERLNVSCNGRCAKQSCFADVDKSHKFIARLTLGSSSRSSSSAARQGGCASMDAVARFRWLPAPSPRLGASGNGAGVGQLRSEQRRQIDRRLRSLKMQARFGQLVTRDMASCLFYTVLQPSNFQSHTPAAVFGLAGHG